MVAIALVLVLVLVLVLALVGVLVALVVHELGHWLAARALGAERVRLRVRRRGVAVEAELHTDVERIWFLLAGPIASAAFGAVLVVAGAGGGWGVVGVVGAVSLVLAVLTLGGSDGRQAWALARNQAKSNDSR